VRTPGVELLTVTGMEYSQAEVMHCASRRDKALSANKMTRE
jgi:hypothetical protein